jgi:hypothetical protein
MAYRKRVTQLTLAGTTGSASMLPPANNGSKLVRVSLAGSTIATSCSLSLTDASSHVLYSATGRTAAGVGTTAEEGAPTDYAEAGAFAEGAVAIAVAAATSGDIIIVTTWWDV